MSPVSGHTENVLPIVIVQLIVIIGAARIFSALFRRMGQPTVCGEIAAGLILGPSLFGGMFPDLFHRIFDPSVGNIFAMPEKRVLHARVDGGVYDLYHDACAAPAGPLE